VTRAVVDTNLLLRMAAGGRRSPLYLAWRARRFALFVSASLLNEFENVVARPSIRRFLSPLRAEEFIMLLRASAFRVAPAAQFPRCRDPKDDVVIATAVAARPCYLVTADRDLYDDADLVAALRALEVTVVRAGEFLAALPD
jgi:putative PIN family toxin of toxin-antitoxin system